MAIASIIGQPFIREEAGGNQPCVQKDPVTEVAATSWLPMSLVYTSGTGASIVLNPVITAGTVVYGMSPDSAKGSATAAALLTPPFALFGLFHYPFDLRDRIIEINIASSTATVTTIGTVNGVTYAGGGTNGVALAPGAQYGILRATSGPYIGMQFLDVNNTTQKIFEIVGLAPATALTVNGATDNNPRVLVKVIPTVIQG